MNSHDFEAAVHPTAHQEKLALTAAYDVQGNKHTDPESQHRRKMQSSRRILFAILALVLVSFGVASAVPASSWSNGPSDGQGDGGLRVQAQGGGSDDPSTFSYLLNAASSEALHEVLHRYFPDRFKDGVYETEKNAMEAVHREDAQLATSLVKIAKRQGGGGGGGNGTATATADVTPEETTPTTLARETTPPANTTPAATTTPRATTTPAAETNPPAPTATNGPATTASPGTLPPSTSRTTTAVASSTTSLEPPTTTAADTTPATNPPTKTTPATRSQRPVTLTFTSTASNGRVEIVTKTSFTDADPTDGATNVSGSLQTNAAVPRARHVAVEAFAGVMLGGLMLV